MLLAGGTKLGRLALPCVGASFKSLAHEYWFRWTELQTQRALLIPPPPRAHVSDVPRAREPMIKITTLNA